MTRQNYMKRLEELENVVLLAPHRFPILDDFVGCYVIVNFNSYNLDEMLPTYKLILNLSNSLMEKCIIGAVDLTFPPNWNLVGPFVGEETPSMLLKRSETKISYMDFNEKKWVQKLLPIQAWGQAIDADTLKDLYSEGKLVRYIEESIYHPMPEDLKIRSIYSDILVAQNKNKYPVYQLIKQFDQNL